MRRLLGVLVLISALGFGVPTTWRTIHRRFEGVRSGVTLEGRSMERYYEGEVRIVVEQMARQAQKAPKSASVHKDTGVVIPHENGLYIDVDQTVYDVVNAPAGTALQLYGIPVVPLLRAEHLQVLTDLLGDFSTPVLGSPDRVSNIRLSLQAINNTLVLPGEVFSFNEIVGERTIERGYRNAPIIVGEAVVPGVGGGVCQTSSTLYNAVREANLEIVERRIHSIAPSYIQHGRDATVAWPHTDFKFRNNTQSPVIVKAEIQKWRVRIWIVGKEGGE